jgi:hypothetical protein
MMAPIFGDQTSRWGARPAQVYRDVPLRREPFVRPFGSEAFPELLWPAPDFLDIPPRRWAQLFPAGPLELWQPFVDVLPAGPSRRWERCFPVVRGGPVRRQERLPVFAGGSTHGEERLGPLGSGRLPRRGV